jgi:hypothetical protein
LIEFISDGSPPIFVFRLVNELCDEISFLFLDDLLQVFVVAEVFELVIPPIGYASDLDLGQLVVFV